MEKSSKLDRKKQNYIYSQMIYVEICKDDTCQKQTVRANKFKVIEYKMNTQKSAGVLYIRNGKHKKEIKKAIPLIIASKIK